MPLLIKNLIRTSIGFAAVLVFCSLLPFTARAADLDSFIAYSQATGALSLSDNIGGGRGELIPGKAPGTQTQSSKKIVYLTFDDGPSENTDAILSILKQNHIHATFFV